MKLPNKSPEPTAVGALHSAVAGVYLGSAVAQLALLSR